MQPLLRSVARLSSILLCLDISSVANMPPLSTSCTATPEVFSNITANHAAYTQPIQKSGYRVAGLRWDPLLHRTWATAINCGHPERPRIAILLPEPAQNVSMRPPVLNERPPTVIIHAGDHVQVRYREANLQIQISGVAEDNGSMGSRVHVRVIPISLENDQQSELLGVVLNSQEVEISR